MSSALSKVGSTAFRIIVGRDKKMPVHGDPTREVFETIVFVVVLVLMLKLFVAEAFVIPTGSMATTLWGDQITVTCAECGHESQISASASVGQPRAKATEVSCQNCGFQFEPGKNVAWSSGDRVLVGKYAYHIAEPKRFEVPVFKYPLEPYNSSELTAMNYIKRLIGLPGETIAIYKGDLYRTTSLTYPNRPRPESPLDLWRNSGLVDATYFNDPDALELFRNDGFEMIRKTPDEIMVVRRLVFDFDKQPASLQGRYKTRWHKVPTEDAGWEMQDRGFRHEGDAFGWVAYHHFKSGWKEPSNIRQPQYIEDELAYNLDRDNKPAHGQNWVPDLLVECDAEIQSPSDTITLELTKAGDRYQAVFVDGVCKLVRYPKSDIARVEMAEVPTKLTKAGKYALRLANIDARLTVWVNGSPLDFGGQADYTPPDRKDFTPTKRDEESPARIGCKGNVTFSKVQLWRDVYYTCSGVGVSTCGVETFYVQPDHFFCLGDNSASSADSRSWGLVPRRLLLGRAVVVYWPWYRWGVIK